MSTDTTATFDQEVVTHAKVRRVTVPSGHTLALITLDNGFDHTKPNTFGPGGLDSLDAALDTALASDVDAVAVTGKPFIFAVGADLTGVPHVADREQARAIGRRGHAVFRRLADGGKPSFAFVNGAAMGGGLELALHATYRTLSSGAPAVALPECFLGLVPGWGGTYLLPHLVGPDRAVTVMVDNALANNTMLTGPKAFALGLADALFEPADFLAESLRWAGRVLAGEVTVERAPVDTGTPWAEAVARGRALVAARTAGAAPAPARALDLLELAATADRDTAFAAEDEALADLMFSDELRAGLYAFDLVQKRARRPAGAPDRALARRVTKVGVVGAGLMASQLALLFARRLQVPVVLTDLDQSRLDKGLAYVAAEVGKLAARGRLSADAANRLTSLVTGSLTKDAFADADVVIEAVFEELSVKQQVFAEVEAVVSDSCLLLTNTSSLSITEMAAGLAHPERVVGFHFFNPVAVLPLLEVVRAQATDDASLATAFGLAKSLGKSAVLTADRPAFVVNRLLTRFMGVITEAVDAGTPFDVADSALAPLGLPMTPFTLLALVGPAVALHVAETLHAAFPDRFPVSANLASVVAAGKTAILGPDGHVDPEVAALFVAPQHPEVLDAAAVRERALQALATEIALMLDEGVVADARDIDLCMLLGAGWPFWLGGITPYLDRAGVSERAVGHRFLPAGVASVS